MLGKFKKSPEYIAPLFAHVFVHGTFTFYITLFSTGLMILAFGLMAFDMTCHFIMDRIKASPDILGRFKPLTKETYPTATMDEKKSNMYFWWSLGLDQSVHHLTHYAIIYFIIKAIS